MPHRFRAMAALTLPALPVLLLAAPGAAQRFTGEPANVVAVEVPVQVVRDGEPVRGLAADDFAVSEGRRKLKVTHFEVVDLARPGASSGGTAATAARSRRGGTSCSSSTSPSPPPAWSPRHGRRRATWW